MNYWYMQLHPDDKEWCREEELLKKTNLIGVQSNELNELETFKEKVAIGDIILIRRYTQSIALVEIVGEFEDGFTHTIDSENYISNDDYSRLDWFRYRREVKILRFINNIIDFSLDNKSLIKPRKGRHPYKYIETLHKEISPSFYKNQKGLKLQKIYIQKYNMFEEFNLNFNEKITVIAGINGSGKTTLLEYIDNFSKYILDKDDDRSSIEFEMYSEDLNKSKTETIEYRNSKSLSSKYFEENIIYFPTGTDIKNIKEFLPEYLYDMVWVDKMNVDDAYARVRKFINEIFKELNMKIEFDSRDVQGNLFFKNKKEELFSIDKISTGEKTLLSKVLYLYIKDIKDKVILIDEPELSLHPSWQNKILKLYENFAEKNNCQIIIATHSPHIIGSAKNEYIRILTEDGVINDVLAYGRDIKWVLKEMGLESTRLPEILNMIKACKELLDDDNYDEAEKCIDEIESIIGKNDSEVSALRNSLEFWRE